MNFCIFLYNPHQFSVCFNDLVVGRTEETDRFFYLGILTDCLVATISSLDRQQKNTLYTLGLHTRPSDFELPFYLVASEGYRIQTVLLFIHR